MASIEITGYEEGGHCSHCGRALKHCIKVDGVRVVGAVCFAKILTKPRLYYGKKYRLGADQIIYMAKARERYSEAGLQRLGLSAGHMQFELADSEAGR